MNYSVMSLRFRLKAKLSCQTWYRVKKHTTIPATLIITLSLLTITLTLAEPSHQTNHHPPVETYTYQRADGNRIAEGRGSFPAIDASTVQIEGIPIWIVGVILQRGPNPGELEIGVRTDDGGFLGVWHGLRVEFWVWGRCSRCYSDDGDTKLSRRLVELFSRQFWQHFATDECWIIRAVCVLCEY